MRSKVFALVGLLIVCLASACGGGATAAERVAACERDFTAGVRDRRSDLPASVVTQTAQRFCRANAGMSGDVTDAVYNSLLRDNPSVLHPICVAGLQSELGLTGETIRRLGLRKDMDRFGRNHCDRAVEAGLAQLDRPPSQLEIGQLYTADPKLGAQACFMTGIAEIAGEARDAAEVELAKTFWRRYCNALAENELMDWEGQGLTPAQTRQITAICGRITSELSQGRQKSC